MANIDIDISSFAFSLLLPTNQLSLFAMQQGGYFMIMKEGMVVVGVKERGRLDVGGGAVQRMVESWRGELKKRRKGKKDVHHERRGRATTYFTDTCWP